jgi:chorismate dehydratase
MKTIRIAAVSYYNTLPLIYGILHSGLMNNFELQLEVPAVCAKKLMQKEVDLALVPIGALPQIQPYQVISDFCIGASGNVKTVLLLSETPIESIHKVYLDMDSLTSVNLVKILAKRFWKIKSEWCNQVVDEKINLLPGEGIVMIGDKAFGMDKKFAYCYDLAGEWFKFTGLPFVFAAWITQNTLSPAFIQDFNASLNWGLQHRAESISLARNLMISENALTEYLQKDISFHLDAQKKTALDLFLRYFTEDLLS